MFCVLLTLAVGPRMLVGELLGSCAAVYLPHHVIGEAAPVISSPGICYFCGLLNAAPVGV